MSCRPSKRCSGAEQIRHLDRLARRVYEVAGWHVELSDAGEIGSLYSVLAALPAVSIDHLGLSRMGFATLLRLAEQGIKVKASGFGRVDHDVKNALKDLVSANPHAPMFGTDLPSTRASKPYEDSDYKLIVDAVPEYAHRVLFSNAAAFYRPAKAD
jgi:predicted TIM-barrel fold metal-dependent hydrolase